MLDALLEDAERAYATREAELEEMAGEGAMRQLERNVLLNVIDRKWREHLYEMDYLKEGIGLRAMAQRDPLVEYQREGYDMFIGDARRPEGGVGRLPVQRRRRGGARPQVAPVEAPEGLAEFATAAAAGAQQQRRGAVRPPSARPTQRCAPRELTTRRRPLTYSGPPRTARRQVQRNGGDGKAPAGVPGGASRRERREAARQQGRGAKPPKSVRAPLTRHGFEASASCARVAAPATFGA